MSAPETLWADLQELGRISEEPGRLTRTFFSPAMEEAAKFIGSRMQDAGLEPQVDPVGNVVGRLASTRPKAKTLLLGSHYDTVRNAGSYDGALGVLLPIAALMEVQRRGVVLPFHVEVIGFSEEEGVRFASAYLGSEAFVGKLKASTLALQDAEGVTVKTALENLSGAPFQIPRPAHKRGEVLGYVEVHIEQGPVLEAAKLAVGVVSAIAGQSRFRLRWSGKAGHAGTTPMRLRRDALAGAAEFALAVEKLAQTTDGLVGTIGVLTVAPGAANVIPAEVGHTLDVRHASDRVRLAAIAKLQGLAVKIAKRRGLKCVWQKTQDNAAVDCSLALSSALSRSVKTVQGRSLSLVSGAGHDAVVLAQLAPVAMLFVRCREGLSHHPDEYASPQDIAVALEVMVDFITQLAQAHA